MFDYSSYLSTTEIARSLPGQRGAKCVSVPTVFRWIVAGVPARDGTRVKLKALRVGRRWLVKREDLDDFFSRLAGPTEPDPSPQRTPTQRRKASEAAARRLEAVGA